MIDWSHYQPDKIYGNDAILDSMMDSLNEDCVMEVLKYLNPLQLQNIGKRDLEISKIINSRMSRAMSCVKITAETVGIIGIMNFYYLLFQYGTKIDELHVSITAFQSTFGLYTCHKYTILFLIQKWARNLKTLCLTGFELDVQNNAVLGQMYGEDKDEEDIKGLIDLMEANGVTITYKHVVNEVKPFHCSFLLPQK